LIITSVLRIKLAEAVATTIESIGSLVWGSMGRLPAVMAGFVALVVTFVTSHYGRCCG
jgi:hypothetical protein